jgi:adenine-specific DNA-methyltransferase
VLNDSAAINLTCYHGFQPNLIGTKYVRHLFLYLHSAAGREIVSLSLRKYGDALDKFEPNDLNSAHVPTPDEFDRLSTAEIAAALECARRGQDLPASIEKLFRRMMSVGETLTPSP